MFPGYQAEPLWKGLPKRIPFDGINVQDVLDSARPIASYTALRAYTGRATSMRITARGIGGFFLRDDADTTTADDGGLTIVDASGRRWKRLYDGPLSVKWFGAVGDGITNDTSALNAALAAAAGNWCYFPPGTYLTTDVLLIPSNTRVCGAGRGATTIYSTSLVHGGTNKGHRQFGIESASNISVSDMTLDASGMSPPAGSMRSINCLDSSHYAVERVRFITPGGAVASINCSNYSVRNNDIQVVDVGDGLVDNDGLIDQWWGSHDFQITHNRIRGGSLGGGYYGVLVTGTTTSTDIATNAAGCYNFDISHNYIDGIDSVGIWVNGRTGVNTDFTISSNVINTITSYFGIAVADVRRFSVTGNVIRNTGANGIIAYQESGGGAGGVTGAQDGVIANNVVDSANVLASGSSEGGAAIAVSNNSSGVSVVGNRVSGTTHTYGVALGASTTLCEVVGDNYAAGTLGSIYNAAGATNRIPGGGTYTPTLTNVANVSANAALSCRFQRSGNVVTVTGRVEVTPTAAASTTTQLGISLPVASNLATIGTDLAGVANTSFGLHGAIFADTVNDRAQLQFASTNTSNNVFYFSFQYTVR